MIATDNPKVLSLAHHSQNPLTSAEPLPLTRAQTRRLAEFRFQLRKFLHFSSIAAEGVGLRSQQYQLLQCVWGMPEELDPTIANVAARMLLKHNSAVELVDRTIEQGLLRRCPDPTDHRRILLRMTPHGEKLLASLAAWHLRELEEAGPELIRSLRRVLLAPQQVASPQTPTRIDAARSARTANSGKPRVALG
ncbi:MAG TPA: MarR family winged helix-turn-helix transcriptional regulator [Acidobacteriaceae bacterium]|jgi:DNA-binding MarR family transcriptional regulator|nr:MarR family winged helix-turn-helix transcriptional regulator [Acidobacteriaceae bacterium]